MYYKKNLDFVALIWEDLSYQIDNIDSKDQDKMFYPRFIKIIIHRFLTKDKSISMRNRMFMHTARDDSLLGAEPPKSRKSQEKSDPAISCEESLSKKKSAKAKKGVAPKPKSTKNKAPIKADRGKGLNVLLKVAIAEAALLKEVAKRSKKDFYISYASSSGDGTDFESGVPDEQHRKTSGTNERTSTKPGVPDVPKYDYESKKESWGDGREEDDDDENDSEDENDDNQEDDDTNDDDEETDSDRTKSDRIKIPVLNQSSTEYYEKEEVEKIDNEEKMDEKEDDEVTKELYDDVNMNLGNRDADMTDVDQADNEIASLMDTIVCHKELGSQTSSLNTVPITAVPAITSVFTTTIPPPPPFFNPLLQQATPTPTPTTSEATTSFPSLPDFSYVFKFNDRVTNLEKDLSEIKQVDQYAQALSSIPAIVDRYIDNKLGEAIQKAILAHNLDCREEAQAEKRDYIELVDTSMRAILKEEVNTQLPQILPQAVSDFATPVIEKNVTESLEAAVLARSSSQPKSTYEAAASLFEFELTKILIDKMEKNKSYDKADYKRELYDALVKSYQTNKDLFDTYGEVFTLKRSRDDKDKDQDPSAGSDRGTKRRKSSKEAESSRDSRSKEKKSSSTSKDASHSQHKPSGKSAHAEEPSHTVDDSGVQQNQEFDMGNNDEQPADKEVSKADWFKKPERPPTPDPDWNKRQHVDFRPPQTWISQVARAEEPHTSFDELMDTSFDFSVFVLNRLNIKDLTQEILVGPAFELLKGTYKSLTELEYHLEEYHRDRQVIPQDYFINNDLEYLKGGDLRRRYSTSVIKTKAATYEIKWIKDLKLTNLTINERYDLNVALCMFTRRIVIQRRVEDLQLGVESYQKKLNLTKLDTFRSNIRNRTTYTTYSDPTGVIYKDQNNRNKLTCAVELHKFSDGTLNDVRTDLHDIASGIRMEYLPKRKYSGLDKRRARVIVGN
ncbi:hypothetical protein Tco_1266552 [Tanacetum coccineum]